MVQIEGTNRTSKMCDYFDLHVQSRAAIKSGTVWDTTGAPSGHNLPEVLPRRWLDETPPAQTFHRAIPPMRAKHGGTAAAGDPGA
jgi:hypothetical protein